MYKDILYNRGKYIKLKMIPGKIKWGAMMQWKTSIQAFKRMSWVVYTEMERCLRYYSKKKKPIEEQFLYGVKLYKKKYVFIQI